MKVRSLTELQSKLDQELTWRKKELIDYKFVVNSNKKSTQLTPLIRGGIALGYAHWEGFIKNASSIYVSYISTRKIPLKDIQVNFITLSFIKKMNKGKSVEECLGLTNEFINELNKPCKLYEKDIVETKSNLNYQILEDILKLLGLNVGDFKSNENFINKKLVEPRNDIAHGTYREVSIEDYEIIHKTIIPLMDHFKTSIENICSTGKYRK